MTTLYVLLFCAKALEVVCVLAILIIGVDLTWWTYTGWKREDDRIKAEKKAKTMMEALKEKAKDQLRSSKEAAAWEGFFKESYVRGFDSTGALIYRGARVPTEAAWDYYQKMDELVDTQIFENTEDI